jgi:hypothetical protein
VASFDHQKDTSIHKHKHSMCVIIQFFFFFLVIAMEFKDVLRTEFVKVCGEEGAVFGDAIVLKEGAILAARSVQQ